MYIYTLEINIYVYIYIYTHTHTYIHIPKMLKLHYCHNILMKVFTDILNNTDFKHKML